MTNGSPDRLLTPSKITAWLDCAHYLTLRHQLEDGTLERPRSTFGEMAKMLMEKGETHERDCLTEYEAQGLGVFEVPARDKYESFGAWVQRVGNPMDDGHDVIFQMPFINDGIRGIADFLIRGVDPDTGIAGYEPVDAKLARSEAKPGHVLQLCFYADAITAMTGVSPRNIHIWLGAGRVETLMAKDFGPYWRRLRRQLAGMMDSEPSAAETFPELCYHCDFCEFSPVCTDTLREADSLVYVAGIRSADREALEARNVETLAELAQVQDTVKDMRPERLAQLVAQAALQVEARADVDAPPPFTLIPETEDPVWGRGYEQLPPPDDGDIFLDFEGHPFWRADAGLLFLLGFIAKNDAGEWAFDAFWAHDRNEEAKAAADLVDYIAERRAQYPGMHVYHYSHTERSSLKNMTASYGVREAELAHLVATGVFVDLFPVARNAFQVGAESYGLKHLERLTGYERGHDIDAGAGAVLEYESYMKTGDQASLDSIASYNEDDVRATKALRDWLLAERPDDVAWRAAMLEIEDEHEELNETVAALHQFGPGTPQHLLGDLLGYWLREHRAYIAPKLARFVMDTDDQLEATDTIAGLRCIGTVERLGKTGKVLKNPGMAFMWPEQPVDSAFQKPGAGVMFSGVDGMTVYASICEFDPDTRELQLLWSDMVDEAGVVPSTVVLNDWVNPNPKPDSLHKLAESMLNAEFEGEPNPVSMALLRREAPAFRPGHGPTGGQFSDDLDDMLSWVCHLDHSYVAIQGPPGTGKTYRGAHMVHALVRAGKRVGITAMSHSAIDNLLEEVVKVFVEKNDLGLLKALRKGDEPVSGPLAGVEYTGTNAHCANDELNLIAGTTWLFSGKDMASAPVDVLVVDEAGQLALADAVAASLSAHNMILLGDPLQLPQVAQASHPGRSGDSVLEYVLGDQATITADRGVFLAETRRMHPDVCGFISEQIYEGRLTSYPACATQDSDFGTGLSWLKAHHTGCTTESAEEAEVVAAQIARLIGASWTDMDGVVADLGVDDIMVVAPYNDQVALIRERLDAEPVTKGVRVGTVDKFQGREAPVVFFTMTSSSGEDIKRGMDFLFSRNRLNVAVSRARCLAYLVCTEDLLNTRAGDVEGMRLLSTLSAFVEVCEA